MFLACGFAWDGRDVFATFSVHGFCFFGGTLMQLVPEIEWPDAGMPKLLPRNRLF